MLLDTSVLLSREEVLAVQTRSAVSVVTFGELHAGLLLARDEAQTRQRRRRLEKFRRAFIALPVDDVVAEEYGEVLAVARRERRIEKATDLLIIATARAHGRVLHTLDERQARLAEAVGVPVSGA